MRILVTGANGFIGKTLLVRLAEEGDFAVDSFTRADDVATLPAKVAAVDAIIHLAGENRPADPAAFMDVNGGLTVALCDAVRAAGRPIPLIFASSIQAERDNPYGESKRAGEEAMARLAESPGQSCIIFRLPNVFGKWCRPNYNSAVATFCHNIARGLSIRVDDPAASLTLVYVDDVANSLIAALRAPRPGLRRGAVEPVYDTTVGEVADLLHAFRDSRETLVTERVGTGLIRALYSTYVSYLPTEDFSYAVPVHGDARGVFVEMLKTPDSGQFSFFTAHPGITRGGHYHHSKTEKFLVIKGRARFGFRHILTDEYHSLETSGEEPRIVETVPGWSHDITNIGEEEMIVMLWANEIFDRARPDTVARSV
ncbi:NAD-dependent epimerase/dehydratase family protein [Sphingopyxis granuli]|uniref:UDP-2-acetamido-2,6-beta-L-arabino-hexul-4-ose reductase n=1 Tax=Sphingopyxis granuli TaxID=267128 RepID=UPI001F53C6C0|nr:NAD-dependent epimerase/dehydratase family protein [Sphingopyxis granuli]UNK78546.1 NAD-dependent epimerase/dehydratase family protein [Sphingopyxis granuli]